MKLSRFVITFSLLLSSLFVSWALFSTNGWAKYAFLLLVYVLVMAIVKLLNLTTADLGLMKSNLKDSFITTLPIVTGIFLIFLSVFIVIPELFQDERYNVGLPKLLISIFVVLPVTTVLIEEIYFRGVVLGYSLRNFSQLTAILISSIVFGLWHVFSASSLSVDQVSNAKSGSWLLVIGVVVATSIAGIALSYFRIRTKSLLSPILIHWTINASGMIFAFLAWR